MKTNLHYLGGERYLSQNMHVRGWLIFVVPEEATLDRIQFITGFLGTKSVDIPVKYLPEAVTVPSAAIVILSKELNPDGTFLFNSTSAKNAYGYPDPESDA